MASVAQMVEKVQVVQVLSVIQEPAGAAGSQDQVVSMVVEPESGQAQTYSMTHGTWAQLVLAQGCHMRRTWLGPFHGGDHGGHDLWD